MKILAPVDRSGRDAIVLSYINGIAGPLNAQIGILHAVPQSKAIFPRALREAEAYAEAVVMGLAEQGIAAQSFVAKGSPAARIVATADEFEADLIVMATRGRKGIGKLVLGSVASEVLATSFRPVLMLSESVGIAQPAEDTKLQAAYLGTVARQIVQRGLLSEEDTQGLLAQLGTQGLDITSLVAAYQIPEAYQPSLDTFDREFQIQTLTAYLPKDVVDWVCRELLRIPDIMAA